ncbi:unnamed protein product [Heligmosomoides polygyrus]|uniref:Uncharacterized protein n=1 Tax=Heligmosomoides polygyrus TaxID=6339 RepID=A0A183FHB0_HELPZ|nr:unnamed protein product [Heligmosomoides polygyrus]
MLRCQLDSRGMLYHELSEEGSAVTANICSTQLQELGEAMSLERRGRKNGDLLHDNTRHHVANPEDAGA